MYYYALFLFNIFTSVFIIIVIILILGSFMFLLLNCLCMWRSVISIHAYVVACRAGSQFCRGPSPFVSSSMRQELKIMGKGP